MSIEDFLGELPLVDHHVHGALRDDVGRDALERMLTESDRPIPAGTTQFDSQIGFAVLRWCAPVLGLEPHASPEDYVRRRTELGTAEVNRRLLAASGTGHYLLETGYRGDDILGPAEMAAAANARVDEIVRLEAVAEELAASQVSAREFVRRYPEVLAERTADAVGLKSIVAYRYGFDFEPHRPDGSEVEVAAGKWLRTTEEAGTSRLDDPVLLRFLLWSGIDRGLPLQLHTGYGDPDLRLNRCDPLLLADWLELVEPSGVDVLLLHCYPYHRHAGYLAQVYPHVYFDVGLGINYTGVRSAALIAESLELAPFAKILFSSDAWGPAELHHLGALLWRRGMARVLGTWVADGDWAATDAIRVAGMIGGGNARRVYRLPGGEGAAR
ncbi:MULTISPECIES: amidohydrolase family protein [Amycolatopsis]|uniref:Amidohydrolase-related domain-containing protein n=2 Tax=Amycolatopsis TaxID=1813 RepID=A0A1I4BL29_9PSEU|nr:amidohydrolase family protein [Amycolatopsis sacchari]SFK69498.1 hypothetical protein SAMN05421835_12924 [Amycolatopsis sacchari]